MRIQGRREMWVRLGALGTAVFAVGMALPLLFGDPVEDSLVAAGGADDVTFDEFEEGGDADSSPSGSEQGEQEGPLESSAAGDPDAAVTSGATGQPGTAGRPAAGAGAGAADPETDAGPAAPTRTGEPLTASDVGVTPTSVKLGLLLLQVGAVEQIGFAVGADVEQQREAWEVFVAEVNRRGGIHGRKIEPVYAQYDVLSPETLRAACLKLTQDAKVFAVIDGAGVFLGPAQLCVTEENATSLFAVGASGVTDDYFARSGGRLFVLYQRSGRVMRNFAEELHRGGHLRGRTVGLLGDESEKTTLDLLESELQRHGYELAHRTAFSSDNAAAASQVPVELQSMRQKGVDVVLMAGNVIATTQFVQAADGQGYRPKYFASDWASNSQDAAQQNQPDSFEGALAFSVRRSGDHLVGAPEPAVEKRCRELYEQGAGEKLTRGEINTSLYTLMCSSLDVAVAGMTQAGPELTRPSLTTGVERVGRVELSQMGGGAFGPGKHDAADLIRINRWAADCHCWKPATEFRRTTY